MCEMKIIGHADVAKHVQFTLIGSRICNTVCKKCKTNMLQYNGPKNSNIILLQSFCDMVDKTNETISNLATQCVCVYRVQIEKWQTVIMYKFQTNPLGLIKIQSN